MPNAYNYSNTAVQTALAGSISGAATSMTVGATTGFPPTTPYVLAVDYGAATEELVVVTGVAGTTLTVSRGFSGTSAQSHSLGAVVRHVVNAQDLTDFRTHEASTGAVHGLTGSIVGTSDTQTLTNKTLTSPTINGGTWSGGGALSGTFTGTPTLSGAVTFSGTPVFSGTTAMTVTGEIAHSSLFRGTRSTATDSQWETRQTGDSAARLFIQADGRHWWGSGSATVDTNLYRSAADTLRTDDNFIVGAGLTVSSTTWTAFTPSWTGIGGATFSRNVGWYYKLGKVVFFEIYAVANGAGSGTTGVQVNLPSTPFREGDGAANTTRQLVLGWADQMNTMSPGLMFLPVFAGDSGTLSASLRMYDQSIIQAQYIQSGTIFTIQGWYREA